MGKSNASTSARPGETPVHTLKVIGIGFALLVICSGLGYALTGTSGLARATLIFLPLWAIGAGINMYLGVKTAGYSVADEAPILLIVFAVPAAAALGTWWKLH
jgi:hypothetical protein